MPAASLRATLAAGRVVARHAVDLAEGHERAAGGGVEATVQRHDVVELRKLVLEEADRDAAAAATDVGAHDGHAGARAGVDERLLLRRSDRP